MCKRTSEKFLAPYVFAGNDGDTPPRSRFRPMAVSILNRVAIYPAWGKLHLGQPGCIFRLWQTVLRSVRLSAVLVARPRRGPFFLDDFARGGFDAYGHSSEWRLGAPPMMGRILLEAFRRDLHPYALKIHPLR